MCDEEHNEPEDDPYVDEVEIVDLTKWKKRMKGKTHYLNGMKN